VEEVKHSESKEEKRDDSMQSNELGNEMDKSVEESRVVAKAEVVNETGGGNEERNEDAGVDKPLKSVVVDGAASANKDVSVGESDEKVIEVERNAADVKSSSSKNNESSVVGSQHIENEEEDDLGWDDIEDLSSIDDKKATQSQSQSGSISKDDLRKRLSTAEEDEDLSWDIEDDDDEPAKA
jgi:hypothetical protein